MKSLFLCLLLASTPALAQSTSESALSPTERQRTIEATLHLINEEYVSADVAARIEAYLRKRTRIYDTIQDGHQLAGTLTRDLRTVSQDKHLHVQFYPDGVAPGQLWQRDQTSAQREANRSLQYRGLLFDNFGIRDLSVLKGNLGYIRLQYLAPPDVAGPSYTAAMNYLAQTDALIIDLRECGGGMSEYTIPFLCSYFFAEPTHLNSFYWRKGNRTVQSWSYAQVPGQHYGQKPIYILTGRGTFSGAEELAYDLKYLKRATIVGDTTGGGANPGGILRINDRFAMYVSVGRAINPVTQTNWEGIGVVPDTVVVASRALYAAQRMALRHLQTKSYLVPEWRTALGQIETDLTKQQPRLVRHTFRLSGFAKAKDVRVAGSFNGWSDRDRPLVRRGDVWQGETDVEPGKLTYKFIVDGHWLTDPGNRRTEGSGETAHSVLDIVAN